MAGGRDKFKFTMVAGKAMDFATMFNTAFSDGLKGPVAFKLDLTEPAGPSTGGGKQVIQHVRLVPPDGGAAMVIGSTNPVVMTAELRTFRHLADIHQRRYKGTPLPIDPAAYSELMTQLQNFFSSQGMKVTLNDIAPASLSTPPPANLVAAPAASAESGARSWIIVALVVAILIISGAAVFVLRHRG